MEGAGNTQFLSYLDRFGWLNGKEWQFSADA